MFWLEICRDWCGGGLSLMLEWSVRWLVGCRNQSWSDLDLLSEQSQWRRGFLVGLVC